MGIEKNERLQSFSRKGPESVVYAKEVFLQKKIQKKENVFVDFTTNSLRQGRGM